MTPRKKKEPATELPFEEAIARLEGIVEALEGGETPLEKSLELFEEGVRLSRGCLTRLDAAEKRIELLLHDEETGEEKVVPFLDEESD